MRCCTWSIPPYRLADLTTQWLGNIRPATCGRKQSDPRRICANPAVAELDLQRRAYLSLAFDAMCGNFDRLCELDWQLSATKVARESREGSFKLGVRLLKIFYSL